jgi:hypothetical protein
MTAQDIYNRYKLGIPGVFETVGEADEAILAAIKEALNEGRKEVSLALFQCREELDELKQVHHLKEIENNSLRNRLAELEKEKYNHEMRSLETRREAEGLRIEKNKLEKENKELREGHYKDTTDAYEAGHGDGFYEAMNVSIHVYSGSHDYYTKTFNNEK